MSTAAQIVPAHLTDVQCVRFERLLPGPIERVWDYLTKPDLQQTWLAESTADICETTVCQRPTRLEYSMRDSSGVSSVVTLDLESSGPDVLLVLTHRVSAWLAAAGTVLAVALLVFSFCRPDSVTRQPQSLGLSTLTRAAHAPIPSA